MRKFVLSLIGASVFSAGLAAGTAGALTPPDSSPCPYDAVTCIPDPDYIPEEGEGGNLGGPVKVKCTPMPDGTVKCTVNGKPRPLQG